PLFGLHDKKKIELCFDVLRFNVGDEKKELFVESRVLILETTFVGAESMVLILEMTYVNVESRVSILKTTFVGVESRPSLHAHLQDSDCVSVVFSFLRLPDADLIAPHSNTFCNPSLVNWNWDEVILISSDDDETNVNETIALPVEDADEEIALHNNPFLNPKLLNSYWDDVIFVPSDDDEGHAEEDIYTSVNTQEWLWQETNPRKYLAVTKLDRNTPNIGNNKLHTSSRRELSKVQRNEAIPLSNEEIALDANGSIEGTMSPEGPREGTMSPGGPQYDYMMSSEADDDY
nr:hypothetical protein [Tanacetum cinerariifolium]